MTNEWLDGLSRHVREGRACVVITVIAVRGSAPRGVGTHMTLAIAGPLDPESADPAADPAADTDTSRVAATDTVRDTPLAGSEALLVDGTIGGGTLEHTAIGRARELLAAPDDGALVITEDFVLGKALSQCCGGEVTLQFERHPRNDFRVEVFGAGHVARELARLLLRLPCIATFHDERVEWLERLTRLEGGERLRTRQLGADVHGLVEAGPVGAYWLVMTHSHERDLEVVEAVLSRGDSAYCGLIASRSKAASFRGRLARKGFSDAEIAKLDAPLGQRVRTGSTPMEVAIAAVADVLDARNA